MKRGFAIGIVFLSIFFSISVVLMSYVNFFHEPAEIKAEPIEETPAPVNKIIVDESDKGEESVHMNVILGEEGVEPSYLSINKGDVVTWINNGSTARRFWINEEIYSELLEPGESYSYRFLETGEHVYRDVFNGNVRGKINVSGSRITGNFLSGVPAIYKDIIGLQVMALSIGILFILHENQK